MEDKKQSCNQCARCCQYFCVEVDAPDTMEEIDDYAWIIAHEGASIHIEDDDWHLYVRSRCKYLGENGACGIYEKRPNICRQHTPGECEMNSDHDLDYDDADVIITDIDQLYEFGAKYIEEKKKEEAELDEDEDEDGDDYEDDQDDDEDIEDDDDEDTLKDEE